MAGTRNGRTVLAAAADARSMRPLRAVLSRASAVPEVLLSRLLSLVAEAGTMTEQNNFNDGIGSEDGSIADRGLQWALKLLSSALVDVSEASLGSKGGPVEAVHMALLALAAAPTLCSPDQHLDAAEGNAQTFNSLKHACEVLKAPPRQVEAASGDAAAKTLLASSQSLSSVAVAASIVQQAKQPKVRQMLKGAADAHMELEVLLTQRIHFAKLMKVMTPELAQHREGVAALCLEMERARSRSLEEAHAGLSRALWGPESDGLWQDPSMLPELRQLTNRMLRLADQAWRESVNLAAETLDDKNVLSASSEDISAAAKRYKDMRDEVGRYSSRLSKMEQAASTSQGKGAGVGDMPRGSTADKVGHVPDPTPAEVAAAGKRQASIATLRASVEKAALSVGVPMSQPPAQKLQPAKQPPQTAAGTSSFSNAPAASSSKFPRPAAEAAGSSNAVPEADVKVELAKYAGAIACFKRYENVPVRDLWEKSCAAGLAYWKDHATSGAELAEVAKQARGAFYEAVLPPNSVSPESLTCGLGRALVRFQIVPEFKPLVLSTLDDVVGRLAVLDTKDVGTTAEDHEACEENAVTLAIAELQNAKVLPSNFKWVPKPGPRTVESLNVEVSKYAVAVAYFRRYEKVPVRELFESALKDGLRYWKETPPSGVRVAEVAQQARSAFDEAIKAGTSPMSIAVGLGRAVTRFLLVDKFKPYVQQAIASVQLSTPVTSQDPGTSASDYHTVCESEAMEGAIGALKKSGIVPSTFTWTAATSTAPSSRQPAAEEASLQANGR